MAAAGGAPEGATAPAAGRVNVALIPEAQRALEALRSRTGLKKVDLVNRALVVYECLDAQTRAGSQVVFKDEVGNEQRLMLLF